jgi:hypothetical protein
MARAVCSSAPLSGAANFIRTNRLGWLFEKPFLVLSLVALLSILLNNHDPAGRDGSFLAEVRPNYDVRLARALAARLFSVFASRIANGFFWQRAPGKPLFVAAVGAMVVSTVLAAAWPFNGFKKSLELESLNALQLLFIWGYEPGMFLA